MTKAQHVEKLKLCLAYASLATGCNNLALLSLLLYFFWPYINLSLSYTISLPESFHFFYIFRLVLCWADGLKKLKASLGEF